MWKRRSAAVALLVGGATLVGCEQTQPTEIVPDLGVPADLAPDPGPPDLLPPPVVENPAKWDAVEALGFYDVDATGQPRAIRNDLTGTLSGMVQFGQSHTVDPAGNAAKSHPTLVAERAALLLFTPSVPGIEQLKVVVTVNGVKKGELSLLHPNEQFRSDYANADGRADLVYSRRAWTTVLPWDWVVGGMALSFADQQQRSGSLEAGKIELAAPGEIVFQSLRLGMLTDPPRSGDGYFLDSPAKAAADYFQTIPAARLVAGTYDDVKLTEAIVANGTIYTTASTQNGDVYGGDLREQVAKSQVSSGINLANMGIPSAPMSQQNPHLFVQMTIHLAAGNYANGVQVHGLSGGNGIITLLDAEGNEFSHEVGHAYGLGHYPGSDSMAVPNLQYFWSAHHADSGWGFIAYRKRMRANVHWRWDGTGTEVNGVKSDRAFQGLYSYNRDAMSSGEVTSSLSRFTHYTGYSAYTQIQNWLNRAVPDATVPSGYKKWNPATRQMEPHSFPAADNRLPATKVGVPVYTLLGGYDPLVKALINPVFRGNYGNVFNLPEAGTDLNQRACYMEIGFGDGSTKRVALADTRHTATIINQFQINIEQSADPRTARLLCRAGGGAAPVELATRSFPTGLAPMPAPVVIGRDKGYTSLRNVELPELEQKLLAMKDALHPVPDAATQLLLTSWGDALRMLSTDAQGVAQRIDEDRVRIRDIERFMNRNGALVDAGDAATKAALFKLIRDAGLAEGATRIVPGGQPVTVDGGKCLKVDRTAEPQLVVVPVAQCAAEDAQRWFMDARGAIHSAALPTRCITTSGTFNARLTLATCQPDSIQQRWRYGTDTVLTWESQANRVIDLNRTEGYPVLYSPSGGANQKWAGLTRSTSPLVVFVGATNLARLYRLETP